MNTGVVTPNTFRKKYCVELNCTLMDACTSCAPGTTVTVADANLVGSACDVAVTVAFGGFGMLVGAVYSPVWEIALPTETVQVTALFEVPVTFAANCRDWLAGTVVV